MSLQHEQCESLWKDKETVTITRPIYDRTQNNGGKTSYYDVPSDANTLNDLVEYKQMYPFQYEIFKASYALKERATRATDGTSSLERELNKIIYYAERGKALLARGRLK
jgi:hypothetical protein